MINSKSKIYVAGHKGLVGSAIVRKLKIKGYKNIIYKTRKELDLTNQKNVYNFLKKNKPEFIFIAAAKVGGIYSNNKFKADYIYENLAIQLNIIHSAHLCEIKDLIFLGSSCVYPRNCKQPIKEKYLLSGKLEETNDAYAIAKIAGIKMCESYNSQYKKNYKCIMPTNTVGPNDNYDNLNSHFFPALIKKAHNIKIQNKNKLILWGNGLAKREVIYVDDLADACIYFMKNKIKENIINIGTGVDFTINEYAKRILKLIIPNKKISIKYDIEKPNGTPRKVLDINLAKSYGWTPKTKLNDAILKTYWDFLKLKK
jgi:GDP-L-fucose synthase